MQMLNKLSTTGFCVVCHKRVFIPKIMCNSIFYTIFFSAGHCKVPTQYNKILQLYDKK